MTVPTLTQSKWQSVLLIITDGKRMECPCGNLALILTMKTSQENDLSAMHDMTPWCQACYEAESERQEEEENEH